MTDTEIETLVDNLWETGSVGCSRENIWDDDPYVTPDLASYSEFEINKGSNSLRVKPQDITVSKRALVEALRYLHSKTHYENNKCEIDSDKNPDRSGPLCQVTRDVNANTRCINYVLPILQRAGLVLTDGRKPNRVWLLHN